MNTPIDFKDPANEEIPAHFEKCSYCEEFFDPMDLYELSFDIIDNQVCLSCYNKHHDID